MELMDLIYSRQSCRKFKDTPVPDEDVRKILDVMRVAPSTENNQNWHFIVVRNQDFKDKLRELIQRKTDELVAECAQYDEKIAKRFGKFVRLFTLFCLDAPVLVMIYSWTAPPAADREYKLIGRPQEMIDELQLQSPAMQSLGCAIEHAALACMELGYATTLMTSQNWMHKDIEELVKQEIGFEREGWFLASMFPIGVPDGELKSPPRKSLDEITTFYD